MFVKRIRKYNYFINEQDALKITYIKNTKKSKLHTIFGECCTSLFNKLLMLKNIG